MLSLAGVAEKAQYRKRGISMYDERRVADSLRACRDVKTFYQTGVFENPKNIFDLDTFLPAAKVEQRQAERSLRVEHDEAFEARLQEALEYGSKVRRERRRPTAEEIAESQSRTMDEKHRHSTERTETVRRAVAEATAAQPLHVPGEKIEPVSHRESNKAVLQDEPALSRREKKELRRQQKAEAKEAAIHQELNREVTDEEDEEEEISFFGVLLQRFLELAVCVLIALGLSAGFNHFIGTHTIVDGTSMEGTLHDEDNLFVNKIVYRLHDPERFDIIVFPYDEDTYYIKRIIGLPGETVEIVGGQICIDGVVLQENYGLEPMSDTDNTYGPVTLGEDEYFVLGDNRNHSTDSRSSDVGFIKKDKIIGKAMYRLYPFDTMGELQ